MLPFRSFCLTPSNVRSSSCPGVDCLVLKVLITLGSCLLPLHPTSTQCCQRKAQVRHASDRMMLPPATQLPPLVYTTRSTPAWLSCANITLLSEMVTSRDLLDQDGGTVRRGLFSRASSATINFPLVFNSIDGTADGTDISIAQGLLSPGLRCRSSFTQTSDTQSRFGACNVGTTPEILAESIEISGADGQGHNRRGTSNTWTSSSGGVLEDLEDVEEDRTAFVHEYNRLGRKVSLHVLQMTACWFKLVRALI